MAKPYKIKRNRYTGSVKPRPHPLFVVVIILLIGGLAYVGFVSYQPIYDAIMSWGEARQQVQEPGPDPDPPLPAEESEASQPLPAPEPVQVTTGLKAVYLPQSLVMDAGALNLFLDGLADTPVNAVMVDIKNKSGQVLFASQNPQAQSWNAVASGAFDLGSLNALLKARGLSLVVRMSAFRDETAARGAPELAVNYRAPGTTWLDNFPDMGGKPWLNPYSQGARDYLTALALEAVEAGAMMVVFEDFQFPGNSLTADAYFGESGGLSRGEMLAQYARELSDVLQQKGARAFVYLTAAGLAAGPNATLYGGPPQDAFGDHILLGALPYQFQEGFAAEGLRLSKPLSDPAATVKEVAAYAQKQLPGRELMALIQGGNEAGGIQYDAAQIAAQANALQALGIEEYLLYCTDSGAYLLEGLS